MFEIIPIPNLSKYGILKYVIFEDNSMDSQVDIIQNCENVIPKVRRGFETLHLQLSGMLTQPILVVLKV